MKQMIASGLPGHGKTNAGIDKETWQEHAARSAAEKQAAADLRRYYRKEVVVARSMGVRFFKVGVHTIAYTCDKDVITFATTIKNPSDPNNDLYARFIAAERYMAGIVAFVRKPTFYRTPTDWLDQMFYETDW